MTHSDSRKRHSAAYSGNQRRRCGKYVYEFSHAQFAAFPSPLPGALNLLRANQGFPERHPWLNSYAPSGAKETNTKFLLRQQEVTDLHYKLQSRYAARLLV